jgi:hypothetical protein
VTLILLPAPACLSSLVWQLGFCGFLGLRWPKKQVALVVGGGFQAPDAQHHAPERHRIQHLFAPSLGRYAAVFVRSGGFVDLFGQLVPETEYFGAAHRGVNGASNYHREDNYGKKFHSYLQ